MKLLTTALRIVPISLMVLAGCGDAEDSIYLVPVKGKVIGADGEPLANASISFLPEPGNADQTPGGDTSGPAGTYMASFRMRSGLAPGKYKVSITPGVETPDIEVDSLTKETFKDDPVMLAMMKKSAPVPRAAKKKKPEYREEFSVEVKDDGAPLDFTVKPAPAKTAGR